MIHCWSITNESYSYFKSEPYRQKVCLKLLGIAVMLDRQDHPTGQTGKHQIDTRSRFEVVQITRCNFSVNDIRLAVQLLFAYAVMVFQTQMFHQNIIITAGFI